MVSVLMGKCEPREFRAAASPRPASGPQFRYRRTDSSTVSIASSIGPLVVAEPSQSPSKVHGPNRIVGGDPAIVLDRLLRGAHRAGEVMDRAVAVGEVRQ
jgi:hypothetical protein